MTSMYQISDESLNQIRAQSKTRDSFQNWIAEINRSQGQFETYKIPNFKIVQGEAEFLELITLAKERKL